MNYRRQARHPVISSGANKYLLKWRCVKMKNEKLVYSTPSIKVTLVDEDILTMSADETVTFEEATLDE